MGGYSSRAHTLIDATTFQQAGPLCLVILISIINLVTLISTSELSPRSLPESAAKVGQPARLDCQLGEQRYFNYESATRVWGSANQQVHLRASLRLRCMEPPSDNTLKYLAEIIELGPSFGDERAGKAKKSRQTADKQSRRSLVPVDASLTPTQSSAKLAQWPLQQAKGSWDAEVHAEPVFEEVGEAISSTAGRVKRSVSGWFSKTWGVVKDFFVNIFESSEKSTVSREQAFRDSGIDIANQCKAGKDRPPGKGLPIDESIFEDLEPKYYIGASLDASGTAYEFADDQNSGRANEQDEGEDLSFFDDPKPKASRLKRAANQASKTSQLGKDYERLLKLPYVFLQSRLGRIIEVRFSNEETDISVKNFKRHLCDLFATNLDKNKTQTNEISPIGQHTTRYLVDSSTNSSAIKQSLMLNNAGPKDDSQQLVRVLASQSASSRDPSFASPKGQSSEEQGRDRGSSEAGSLGDSLSVLRSINSTSNIQLNSRTTVPDIDRIRVRVKQLQHISEGRLTNTAGQLSMSLIQVNDRSARVKREATTNAADNNDDDDRKNGQQIDDIADLLQVSTSFTMQLVAPKAIASNFLDSADSAGSHGRRLERSLAPEFRVEPDGGVAVNGRVLTENSKNSDNGKDKRANGQLASGGGSGAVDKGAQRQVGLSQTNQTGNGVGNSTRSKREPLVTRPSNSSELQKMIEEWRQLELELQLTPTSLLPETSSQDGQLQRLEILRDQIQMRINEEFLRNKLRRSAESRQVATAAASASLEPIAAIRDGASKLRPSARSNNDLGLSLTQVILGSGITSKRKGSIYNTIEEVVELEAALDEDSQVGSVSSLLRNTARVDKLRAHCKSAIASPAEIQAESARLELRSPFNVNDEQSEGHTSNEDRLSRIIQKLATKNEHRLEQCRQVMQLLLRVNDRQAAELVLELLDDCNKRMLSGSKHEELGYGPMSKYYRNLRQQFTELLANINRPSELLLDKLVNRLDQLIKLPNSADQQVAKRRQNSQEQEFVYVPKSTESAQDNGQSSYNRSVLKEEDDYNNNDGAGSLVMTITSLASRASIGRSKRVEVAEKLLSSLKGSSCSLFNAPDIDILESMGNFQEPVDGIVGKVVHLARRCKHHDQYLVACVHGLQGQLGHAITQRFFIEQLMSTNVSCTVKSEIVLTLVNSILIDDLKSLATRPASNDLIVRDQSGNWPSTGLNQVDDVLLELVDEKSKRYVKDRRCLGQLVGYYLSKKRQLATDSTSTGPKQHRQNAGRSGDKRRVGGRNKRAVVNKDGFWDEAQCKRWSIPEYSIEGNSSLGYEMADEVDDNSILVALANNRPSGGKSLRRSQKLVERETDPASNSTSPPIIRRRHKCSASKTYGPKNAEATLKAEIVNDLVGLKDENKFLARFRLATNFLGSKIDVGRMYLWHQRQTTRAYVSILGKSLWDTSHSCQEKAPHHLLYMPLFDFNLWVVKVSVGLRLHSEMGFHSNCEQKEVEGGKRSLTSDRPATSEDELELYPTMTLRASGEASAKFVVARAGMSLTSQYGYQGNIRVSKQPESCMSVYSAHQPMNLTFSSWFQLWDNDCHYWGSRNRAEPQATRWRLSARKPAAWIEDECLNGPRWATNSSSLQDPSPGTINP